MPLRFLIYVTKEYQMLIRNQTLYASTLVELPTPHFVVFYNGEEEREAGSGKCSETVTFILPEGG